MTRKTSYLYDKGYALHVINSIQTDSWRNEVEIRKTEDIGSMLIAELLRYGDFIETIPSDYAM